MAQSIGLKRHISDIAEPVLVSEVCKCTNNTGQHIKCIRNLNS